MNYSENNISIKTLKQQMQHNEGKNTQVEIQLDDKRSKSNLPQYDVNGKTKLQTKNSEMLHQRRLDQLQELTVGLRVTVIGQSRNRGDALVKLLHTGLLEDRVMIEFDNKTTTQEVDPLTLKVYQEDKHCDQLQKKFEITCLEDGLVKGKKRRQFMELKANKQEMFLWRGLRCDECGYGGLHAKAPLSTVNPEASVINGSLLTPYIPCSKSPLVAIYYAAAFNHNSSYNQTCRLAQINISKLHPGSVLDISDENGFMSPDTKNLAVAHQTVLIYEHIPAHAVRFHDLNHLRIPRGVGGSSSEYIDLLLQRQHVLTTLTIWKIEKLKDIIRVEVEDNYNSLEEDEVYPSHVVAIARYISQLQQGPGSPSRDLPLWKKVLNQGKTIIR